jgi:hypothetical protein
MSAIAPAAIALPRPAERARSDAWFVTLIIVVVLGLTSAPYVYGYLSAPPGRQFMGILLDVPDHVQYFSWMRELAAAPLAENKLTPEPNPPLFFNLLWWGLGRLGRLIGVGYAPMFQLLRVAATVLFILAAFRLCAYFLDDRRMQRTALLVILFTSGFGWVLVLAKYTVARGTLWFPLDVYIAEGNTFLGMLAYPHFISAALYVLVFELMLRGEASGRRRYAVAAGLVSLALGWQHAYDLVSIYGVLLDRRLPRALLVDGLILGALSVWPALYSVVLTRADPLWRAVLAQFKNAGVFTPSPLHLPILLGPAFLLALFTLARENPLRLRGVGNRDLFLKVWLLATFALIYLPVEYQIHLLNGWQVPIGILATRGLYRYVAPAVATWRARRRPAARPADSRAVPAALAAALLVAIVPTNLYLWAWRFVDLSRHDYPYSLRADEVQALDWLDRHAAPDDVVLASLTLGQYVPVLTGSHAVLAHWAQTVDFYGKSERVAEFFAAATPDRRRQATLRAYSVDYVLVGPAEQALGGFQPGTAPYLRLVYTTPQVQVYAVDLDRSTSP